MRLLLVIATLLGLGTPARADDAHAEMAAALAAQADLQPSPVALPTWSAAPRHAAAQSAVKRGITKRAVNDSARAAASQVSRQAQAQGGSQVLVRQADAATAAAAGQAQAKAAKDRITPHPRTR